MDEMLLFYREYIAAVSVFTDRRSVQMSVASAAASWFVEVRCQSCVRRRRRKGNVVTMCCCCCLFAPAVASN